MLQTRNVYRTSWSKLSGSRLIGSAKGPLHRKNSYFSELFDKVAQDLAHDETLKTSFEELKKNKNVTSLTNKISLIDNTMYHMDTWFSGRLRNIWNIMTTHITEFGKPNQPQVWDTKWFNEKENKLYKFFDILLSKRTERLRKSCLKIKNNWGQCIEFSQVVLSDDRSLVPIKLKFFQRVSMALRKTRLERGLIYHVPPLLSMVTGSLNTSDIKRLYAEYPNIPLSNVLKVVEYDLYPRLLALWERSVLPQFDTEINSNAAEVLSKLGYQTKDKVPTVEEFIKQENSSIRKLLRIHSINLIGARFDEETDKIQILTQGLVTTMVMNKNDGSINIQRTVVEMAISPKPDGDLIVSGCNLIGTA